ncbi:MAG: TRAP transporter substrate-binding protein [Candidatus Competibacterales bacterium]
MTRLLLACCLWLITLCAFAAETLTFGIGGTPQSLQGRTAQEFTDRLQQRLGDDYNVELYLSGQIGDERELVQKLRLGTVDLALVSSIMSSLVDEFALFDLPFLVADREHLKRIDAEIVKGELAAAAEARGLHIVSTWENGFRQITNSARPIVTPKDLEGIKLRTPQSDWRVMMFRTWGANPTPMAFSEVFVALQTGVIDGQENPMTNIYGAKFNEVQTYLSLTNHVYSPIWLTAGAGRWQQLPPELRTAIEEVAAELQDWALARGAEADAELVDKLQQGGMTVTRAERQAFVDASAPVYKAYAEQVDNGQAYIDRALELATD